MEENKNNAPQENQEQEEKLSKYGHGRNWITDMYDKVNVSVDTLNIIALCLLAFIFLVIFIASKR